MWARAGFAQVIGTISRIVTYDGNSQHHLGVRVLDCAVLGAADVKKIPAQSNHMALLPLHTHPCCGEKLWREMGKEAKATAWELLKVVEGPSPHLLQAQSTSHTTAKAARCSLQPQVLKS